MVPELVTSKTTGPGATTLGSRVTAHSDNRTRTVRGARAVAAPAVIGRTHSIAKQRAIESRGRMVNARRTDVLETVMTCLRVRVPALRRSGHRSELSYSRSRMASRAGNK